MTNQSMVCNCNLCNESKCSNDTRWTLSKLSTPACNCYALSYYVWIVSVVSICGLILVKFIKYESAKKINMFDKSLKHVNAQMMWLFTVLLLKLLLICCAILCTKHALFCCSTLCEKSFTEIITHFRERN